MSNVPSWHREEVLADLVADVIAEGVERFASNRDAILESSDRSLPGITVGDIGVHRVVAQLPVAVLRDVGGSTQRLFDLTYDPLTHGEDVRRVVNFGRRADESEEMFQVRLAATAVVAWEICECVNVKKNSGAFRAYFNGHGALIVDVASKHVLVHVEMVWDD